MSHETTMITRTCETNSISQYLCESKNPIFLYLIRTNESLMTSCLVFMSELIVIQIFLLFSYFYILDHLSKFYLRTYQSVKFVIDAFEIEYS